MPGWEEMIEMRNNGGMLGKPGDAWDIARAAHGILNTIDTKNSKRNEHMQERFEADKHPAYLPMALGTGSVTPLQMASAYSVFASGGYRVNPMLISKVTDNKGRVLNTGLWRYTRHPNYFGDACVWWGIWLASLEAGWPVALGGLIGPLFLTYTLTRWSGKPLLEKGLMLSRPGYADYVTRTSGFIPWPPRHS